MRVQFPAFLMAASIIASSAMAQPAASPVTAFASSKEITALIAKAKAERKDNAPAVIEPILSLAPYRAQLEYRPGTNPAAVHEKDAELIVVIQGTGTAVTGGKLVNEKRNNVNNLGGTSIDGGDSRPLAPGDMLMVPANTPHQIIPGNEPIVLMTMHVPYPPMNWPPAN